MLRQPKYIRKMKIKADLLAKMKRQYPEFIFTHLCEYKFPNGLTNV